MTRTQPRAYNASISHLTWVTLTHRTTAFSGLRVLWIVTRFFFFPQFQTLFLARFRPAKARPVVSVDHPLDKDIPFRPEHVQLYLSFIPLWLKSCAELYRLRGRKALPAMRDYFTFIGDLYREAAEIYLTCQSTTARPNYKKGPFRLIHISDPHLHCVPSLHVMLVAANYYWMAKIYKEWGLTCRRSRENLDWFWEQALSISESVLFIKQHSVNCIPAALFMLSSGEVALNKNEGLAFIEKLFTLLDPDLASAEEIRNYIDSRYLKLLALGKKGLSQKDVVLAFLSEIKNGN